ncbi:MAG: hypothetical protein AAFR47_04020 [Pseudomonadota bacterium]
MDAHARFLAAETRERVASGEVADDPVWPSVGPIPRQAAVAVFVLCPHLGQFAPDVMVVSAFFRAGHCSGARSDRHRR